MILIIIINYRIAKFLTNVEKILGKCQSLTASIGIAWRPDQTRFYVGYIRRDGGQQRNFRDLPCKLSRRRLLSLPPVFF